MDEESCPAELSDARLLVRTWQHLCLTVNDSGITLSTNGTSSTKSLTDILACQIGRANIYNVSMVLGSRLKSQSFSGSVVDTRFYGRQLGQKEIADFAGCLPGPQDFLPVPEGEAEGSAAVSNRSLTEMCEQPPKEFLALIVVRNNHREAKGICEALDGRLIDERDNYTLLAEQIADSRDVYDSTVQVWTRELTKGNHGWALSVTRTSEGSVHHTMEYNCHVRFYAVACFIPSDKTIFMKSDAVQEFSLFSHRRQLMLQSEAGEVLSKASCPGNDSVCFVIKRMGKVEKYSVLGSQHQLLGRREWVSSTTNKPFKAALSTCAEGFFTCDEGTCVDLRRRCDGLHDCPDESDEGSNCVMMAELPSTYWNMVCPQARPVVAVDVALDGVREVILEKNEFEAILSINTTWTDHRLLFINLGHSQLVLHEDIVSQLWVPNIEFLNARYQDNLSLRTKSSLQELYTVKALSNGTQGTLNSYEAMKHNGTDVVVSRTIKYLFAFSCQYDFFAFPFDTQTCDMQLHLQPFQGCQPEWNTSSGGIRVYGNRSTISIYSVSELRYTFDYRNRNVLTLKLLFVRRFEAYLLTTFLPCIILCALSQLTLTHFNLDDFTDRITVTLSLLIVIASLFSQMSSSVPSSPVPKCVDFFFFYCILRVSIVFFMHSSIGRSMASGDRQKDELVAVRGPTNALKLAWPETLQEQKQPVSTCRSRAINAAGICVTLLLDVLVTFVFVVWIIRDHYESHNQFSKYNRTE
ncbi:hypothetical protein C7M84_020852 [Penaeus vannamei]|uniref:Neurotransmitter-gated ion-channel ligand-binding domain-containing protein n=1 Tax=Penaeus vannamei TaxID=6689 RepID=A0A423SAY4_PENVA|nr:hypothetical protein C7M84_020852 [Penaeus vannamei]